MVEWRKNVKEKEKQEKQERQIQEQKNVKSWHLQKQYNREQAEADRKRIKREQREKKENIIFEQAKVLRVASHEWHDTFMRYEQIIKARPTKYTSPPHTNFAEEFASLSQGQVVDTRPYFGEHPFQFSKSLRREIDEAILEEAQANQYTNHRWREILQQYRAIDVSYKKFDEKREEIIRKQNRERDEKRAEQARINRALDERQREENATKVKIGVGIAGTATALYLAVKSDFVRETLLPFGAVGAGLTATYFGIKAGINKFQGKPLGANENRKTAAGLTAALLAGTIGHDVYYFHTAKKNAQLRNQYPAIAMAQNERGDVFLSSNPYASDAEKTAMQDCADASCDVVAITESKTAQYLTYQQISLLDSNEFYLTARVSDAPDEKITEQCHADYAHHLETEGAKPFHEASCNSYTQMCNYEFNGQAANEATKIWLADKPKPEPLAPSVPTPQPKFSTSSISTSETKPDEGQRPAMTSAYNGQGTYFIAEADTQENATQLATSHCEATLPSGSPSNPCIEFSKTISPEEDACIFYGAQRNPNTNAVIYYNEVFTGKHAASKFGQNCIAESGLGSNYPISWCHKDVKRACNFSQ